MNMIFKNPDKITALSCLFINKYYCLNCGKLNIVKIQDECIWSYHDCLICGERKKIFNQMTWH